MRYATHDRLSGALKFSHYFTVTGNSEFPYDMLRYDSCFPRESTDSVAIGYMRGEREIRTVNLVHHSDTAIWEPTVGRWNSFTWNVVHT